MLLPFWTAELKDVVIYIQRESDVKIVRPDGGVGSLRFRCLEVQEADLVPQEGSNVSL